MRQGNHGRQALGQAGEKLVAQLAGGRLDAVAGFGGELAGVAAVGFEREAKSLGRLPDEAGIGVAVRAAELVVEMGDDQAVAQIQSGRGKQVQQRDRVDAA